MPQHLKMFEWLFWAGIVVGLVAFLMGRPTNIEIVLTIIFTLIPLALIWAAARKGQAWAAWLLLIGVVLSLVVVIGQFMGADWAMPETVPTTLAKVLSLISVVLEAAGLYFYFFGDRHARV